MVAKEVGTSRVRREDPALVTGTAGYTADFDPPDLVHAAFLRSPYGHARVDHVDLDAARALDGVVAVADAAALADLGGPSGIPTSSSLPDQDEFERPLLVGDRARFVGDPIAVALAGDRYVARDAVAAIEADLERLPAVTDPIEAIEADGATDGEAGSDTIEWSAGDRSAVEQAVERADHVVSLELDLPRVISAPMEPRSVLAEPGPARAGEDGRPGTDTLTVTSSTQTPHQDRDRIARTLDRPSKTVRVVAPAVGGGFGTKGAHPYPEGPLVAWWATVLDRPVTWAATRTEAQQGDHQGRGVSLRGALALDDDGRIQALRLRGHVGLGGYPLRSPGGAVKTNLLTGPYDIAAVHCHLVGVLTNTVPLGPYRGAGRPETIYVLERLVRRAASVLDVDPAALRRRNYVPSSAFPYETPLGYTYDSGDYATALEQALDVVDYEAVRREQAAARQDGRSLGIGLASFVENTGAPASESARVAVDATGQVRAACGTADTGQGHETAFAQLLADELGVDPDDIAVTDGDTDATPDGTGTFGCRSVPVGGGALVGCARDVVAAARSVAADHPEADPADLEFEAGTFSVTGAPDRSIALTTAAELADDAGDPLVAERDEASPDYTYSFGTHAAVVEVSHETGDVEVRRYVAVDDCGVQLNPMLVDGQVHGGIAQGLGQALREAAVYDDAGSLLTGSFQDYAIHRAGSLPELETRSTVTPSPVTPHGAKGIGEAGTLAAPPALVNAVVDALEPLGVEDVSMPVTPETVWRAASDRD